MKNQAIILLVMISSYACKNDSVKKVDADSISEQEKSYLPITDFIKEDIKQVDSFAGGILLKTIEGKRQDSAFIQPEAFKTLANEFLLPDLDSAIFCNQFTETSLMDETTQMLNFIYMADTTTTSLRKVIVYVSPSKSYDKVSRIYMEKETRKGDTTISHKMNWKIKQYLVIAAIKQAPGGYTSTRIQKAIWDPQHYAD